MMTFADQFHHHASLLSPSLLVFFSVSILWEHICILNARLGGKIDQQTSSCIRPIQNISPGSKNPQENVILFTLKMTKLEMLGF